MAKEASRERRRDVRNLVPSTSADGRHERGRTLFALGSALVAARVAAAGAVSREADSGVGAAHAADKQSAAEVGAEHGPHLGQNRGL
jgi:hypothetical protein